MKKDQPPNFSDPSEKKSNHFKFSLFSSSSDVWILAIALLILLFISFINEKHSYPSSLNQIENNCENKLNKDLFGLG